MNIKKASEELINGNLTTEVYKEIYKKLQWFLNTYTLPKQLTVDDVISIAITNAYNNRDSFDETKSTAITWLYTIAKNEVGMQNKKYNKTQSRIPDNSFVDNQIKSDHGITNIFDTLIIEDDTIDIDSVFNDSEDISIQMYTFILNNDLKLLEEFIYNKLSYQDIADKYDKLLHNVKNKIRSQRFICIEHFKGSKDNSIYKKTIKDIEWHKQYNKMYNEKHKETLKIKQKEYQEANKEKLKAYGKEYRKKQKQNKL